ncbi:Hypothetical_protein [Hexamita inflata]|uniref:Hypothetical_protein n=1 Tax=Hexamita inflata TaxID=28002 RepID=A0AA86TVY3_9EUKA|nr:Hypothetical protein HINF_LOCUS11223 [Hexamita inflata]
MPVWTTIASQLEQTHQDLLFQYFQRSYYIDQVVDFVREKNITTPEQFKQFMIDRVSRDIEIASDLEFGLAKYLMEHSIVFDFGVNNNLIQRKCVKNPIELKKFLNSRSLKLVKHQIEIKMYQFVTGINQSNLLFLKQQFEEQLALLKNTISQVTPTPLQYCVENQIPLEQAAHLGEARLEKLLTGGSTLKNFLELNGDILKVFTKETDLFSLNEYCARNQCNLFELVDKTKKQVAQQLGIKRYDDFESLLFLNSLSVKIAIKLVILEQNDVKNAINLMQKCNELGVANLQSLLELVKNTVFTNIEVGNAEQYARTIKNNQHLFWKTFQKVSPPVEEVFEYLQSKNFKTVAEFINFEQLKHLKALLNRNGSLNELQEAYQIIIRQNTDAFTILKLQTADCILLLDQLQTDIWSLLEQAEIRFLKVVLNSTDSELEILRIQFDKLTKFYFLNNWIKQNELSNQTTLQIISRFLLAEQVKIDDYSKVQQQILFNSLGIKQQMDVNKFCTQTRKFLKFINFNFDYQDLSFGNLVVLQKMLGGLTLFDYVYYQIKDYLMKFSEKSIKQIYTVLLNILNDDLVNSLFKEFDMNLSMNYFCIVQQRSDQFHLVMMLLDAQKALNLQPDEFEQQFSAIYTEIQQQCDMLDEMDGLTEMPVVKRFKALQLACEKVAGVDNFQEQLDILCNKLKIPADEKVENKFNFKGAKDLAQISQAYSIFKRFNFRLQVTQSFFKLYVIIGQWKDEEDWEVIEKEIG